jgi:hypothetical protein
MGAAQLDVNRQFFRQGFDGLFSLREQFQHLQPFGTRNRLADARDLLV